jgi:AFG3 family protein
LLLPKQFWQLALNVYTLCHSMFLAEAPKKPMEGGSGGGGGGNDSLEAMARKGLQQLLPIALVMMAAATLLGAGRQDAQEVSFQWFKTQLLAKGAVEKLEVSNKQMVKV